MSIKRIKEYIESEMNDWRSQRRRMVLGSELRRFGETFNKNFTTFVITAFGLTSALMWQQAIIGFINTMIPRTDPSNYIYQMYAALIVTTLAVVVTYFLSKSKNQA